MTQENRKNSEKRPVLRGWWVAPALLLGLLLWYLIMKGLAALWPLLRG